METRFTPVAVATKFLVLRIMFPLCLASICLSERAAAVEFGSNSGARVQESGCPQPEVAACIPTWSSIKPLPVGPGPGTGHGRHVNPNDYGMCGILSLSGVFNNSTFARTHRRRERLLRSVRKFDGRSPKRSQSGLYLRASRGLHGAPPQLGL